LITENYILYYLYIILFNVQLNIIITHCMFYIKKINIMFSVKKKSMLNSALIHLLNMLKKEIKDKNNSDKITFYTFKTLNAQFF
jgi:hypothetical protein